MQETKEAPRFAATAGVHFFSASQIDTFLACPTKWALRYIAKIEAPSHPSAAFGSIVHKVLEDYMRTGETLPFSSSDPEIARAAEVAASGIHLLPPPKTPGMTLEENFTFELSSTNPRQPLLFRGAKDMRIPTAEVPQVWDHKSTSDLKWAKSEHDLRNDTQAILYAYDEMSRTQSSVVDMNWVYYQTRGPKRAKRVHLRLTSDYVAPLFLKFKPVLEAMLTSLQEKRDPHTFPMDTTHCDAFGGCPYRQECVSRINPFERLDSTMSGLASSEKNLLDTLFKRQGQMEPSAAAPPPSAPKAPETNLLASLLGPTKPAAVAPPAPPSAAQLPLPAVNPPGEWQPPPASVEARDEAPKAEAAPKAKRTRGPNKPKADAAPVVATEEDLMAVVGAEAAGGATPEDVDAVIARMPPADVYKGNAITADLAEKMLAEKNEYIAQLEKRCDGLAQRVDGLVLDRKEVREGTEGFRLFVDCAPMTSTATMGEVHFKAANKRLHARKQVSDWRFISFTGAAEFQAELEKMVADGEITGDVTVTASTPEGGLSLAALMPLAREVVRSR